jgi:hypothetical protein
MKANPAEAPSLISSADLQGLRAADKAAFERIVQSCHTWVRHWKVRDLTRADYEDIVGEAVADVLPLLVSPQVALDEVDISLKRALNRHRARAKRLRARYAEQPAPSLPEANQPGDFILREHFLVVAGAIQRHMRESLARLSSRDRDLLVAAYHLEEPGAEPTGADLEFASESARKKALYRARQRFSLLLEQSLLASLEQAGTDKGILEDALRMVHGAPLGRTLASLREE